MVKLIHSTEELIRERKNEAGEVGFVPTMGNLHAGHISLLERALSEFDVAYFSIFVNPKQFGANEDFDRYPRTLQHDMALIQKTADRFPHKKIIVYAPSNAAEVFPPGHNQTISVEGLSTILEGKIRPGHFDGVTTVVHRLFELTCPRAAFFGLKDYQQYLIIKKMTIDLNLPIKIVGMPIIREESGLALSSRNQYLSTEQKETSLHLFRTLRKISDLIAGKKENINRAQNLIKEILKDQNWNYLELRDSETLAEDLSNSSNISVLAVYQLGSTRLLDNVQIGVT
jgi:pantoate--beta-alanine ligase